MSGLGAFEAPNGFFIFATQLPNWWSTPAHSQPQSTYKYQIKTRAGEVPQPDPRDRSGFCRNIMGRVGSGSFQTLVDRAESLLPDPTQPDVTRRGWARPVKRHDKNRVERTKALHRYRTTADRRDVATQRVINRSHRPIGPVHYGRVINSSYLLHENMKLCSLEELSASIPAVAHKNSPTDQTIYPRFLTPWSRNTTNKTVEY